MGQQQRAHLAERSCDLGAVQPENTQAASSNRCFQLHVLTQEPKDTATGPRWHPYSALTVLTGQVANESVQPFMNLPFLPASCWKVAISTSLCGTQGQAICASARVPRALPTSATTLAADASTAAGREPLQCCQQSCKVPGAKLKGGHVKSTRYLNTPQPIAVVSLLNVPPARSLAACLACCSPW